MNLLTKEDRQLFVNMISNIIQRNPPLSHLNLCNFESQENNNDGEIG